MKSSKSVMKPYLMTWALLIVLLSGTLSHATEIAGNWLTKNPSDGSVLLSFGDADDFFIEDETSWIQGTYTRQPESATGQLDLYIQDGSNGEDVGKTISYFYDIHDNVLTLTKTDPGEIDNPTTLVVVNSVGSSAFIGINTDPPDGELEKDEDDTKWNVYANCFVMSIMAE